MDQLSDHNDRAWKAHLQAALNIYQRGQSRDWVQLGLGHEIRRSISSGLPVPEEGIKAEEKLAGFKFITTTLLWLDVISSITLGRAPLLLSQHSEPLGSAFQVQLEEVFGCGGQIVLHIVQITQLHELKCHASAAGLFDPEHVDVTASAIDAKVRAHLVHDADQTPRQGITQIYTYMAIVYLHLVIHGFQQLDLLNAIITDAIKLVRQQSPKHLLSAMVSPLFFIGVAANREDRLFFRQVLSTPPSADSCLQHRTRILQVLESIWDKCSISDFSWSDCVDLSQGVLLI
jgi:hypothetical protein